MGKANRLSPRQVVALLDYVRTQPTYAADYMSALSVAGYDGTLESRFTRSPLKGLVRAKTGTLNSYGASNLAGYLVLPHEHYVFAILINCRTITQFSHWVSQQNILEAVAHALAD
jgi:D-alanyl-D-alanine carboxypeptidase/D-alanyl-D-alanine-endopeptidase (penicillin-binding protein 4)